jgi:ABC-type Fe3+-hydroxamate transport system substrate-binding protein
MLARSALVALVLAGCAGAAASQERVAASTPPRTAVLAGADAPSGAVATATRRAAGSVTIRHADGTLDAQAQATRLAAEGYDTVVGVGAQARAPVAQAAAGEVGDGTTWETAAR